jgi:hypothetical protein
MTRTRLFTLGLLVPAALGFSAAQARAAGETISITQNDATATVGRATNFTASGTLNPDDTMFGFDIYVFVKGADADPTCAADFDTESANATHSGGNESWVSPPGGFQVGYGPTFNAPFKVTFTGPGNYLVCGYVQGDFSTFASGELRGAVAAAPTTTTPGSGTTTPGSSTTTPGSSTTTTGSTTTPGDTTPAAAIPAIVRRPWVTSKRHVLTCHAGTWSNHPTSRRYRWVVKGHSKKVASGSKLKVRRSLRGRKVVCQVTAQNAAGHKTASSRAVRAR